MKQLRKGPRSTSAVLSGIKLVYFDVDNTLVGNEAPDLPTNEFIKLARELKGKVKIAIASARPLSKVEHILEAIDAEGISILNNGAQLYDHQQKRVVDEWIIDPELAQKIAAKLREMSVYYWINDDGIDHFPQDDGGEVVYARQKDIWDRRSERVVADGYAPEKPFVVVADKLTEEQVSELNEFVANNLVGSGVTTLIAHQTKQDDGSMRYDMFLVNELANKEYALDEALKRQSLEVDEVMMVGDGRNDAVIVEAAGVGVAMGNSAQETLDVATHIAPYQADDGASNVLSELQSSRQ